MSVADYCAWDVATASRDDSVKEAAIKMRETGVGCLVVIDLEKQPIGILSDRDVVTRVLRRRLDPERTSVEEVMTGEVSRIRAGASLSIATRTLRREGIRRAPVVDRDGEIRGLFSTDDALQIISRQLSIVAKTLRRQFSAESQATGEPDV